MRCLNLSLTLLVHLHTQQALRERYKHEKDLRLRSAIQQAQVTATRHELTKDHLTNAGVVIQADLDASQMKLIAAFIAERKPENIAQMQEVFEAALVKHLLTAAKVGAVFGDFFTFQGYLRFETHGWFVHCALPPAESQYSHGGYSRVLWRAIQWRCRVAVCCRQTILQCRSSGVGRRGSCSGDNGRIANLHIGEISGGARTIPMRCLNLSLTQASVQLCPRTSACTTGPEGEVPANKKIREKGCHRSHAAKNSGVRAGKSATIL